MRTRSAAGCSNIRSRSAPTTAISAPITRIATNSRRSTKRKEPSYGSNNAPHEQRCFVSKKRGSVQQHRDEDVSFNVPSKMPKDLTKDVGPLSLISSFTPKGNGDQEKTQFDGMTWQQRALVEKNPQPLRKWTQRKSMPESARDYREPLPRWTKTNGKQDESLTWQQKQLLREEKSDSSMMMDLVVLPIIRISPQIEIGKQHQEIRKRTASLVPNGFGETNRSSWASDLPWWYDPQLEGVLCATLGGGGEQDGDKTASPAPSDTSLEQEMGFQVDSELSQSYPYPPISSPVASIPLCARSAPSTPIRGIAKEEPLRSISLSPHLGRFSSHSNETASVSTSTTLHEFAYAGPNFCNAPNPQTLPVPVFSRKKSCI